MDDPTEAAAGATTTLRYKVAAQRGTASRKPTAEEADVSGDGDAGTAEPTQEQPLDTPLPGLPHGVYRLWQRLPGWGRRIAPHAVYWVVALYVTGRLWVRPTVRVLSSNETDHLQFQWFFANAAWSVRHLHSPLVTDRINFPHQVNLMGNTSFLGMTIPLAPVTMLLGPAVAFAVSLVLALALTAGAWYWFLARYVVDSRFAAWVGGLFLGFAPGMISQAGGHPNLVALFVIPLILGCVLELRKPEHTLRTGVLLGLLTVYQVFMNEEILFLALLGTGAFVVACAVLRPRYVREYWRRYAIGLIVAAVTAGVLLAYPLYVQFYGPGRYQGLPFEIDRYVTDVGAIPAFSSHSLIGDMGSVAHLSNSVTEENTFFGWPLLLLIGLIVVWLRRRVQVWALLVAGAVFASLTVGTGVEVYGRPTGIPGPLKWLIKYPPFDLATPSRYALGLMPVVGILLAMGCAEAIRLSARWRGEIPMHVAWWGAVVAALLPIVPKPLPAVDLPAPRFITSGAWKSYVTPGHTLVAVPLARNNQMDGVQWSTVTGIGFAQPGGYFIGPTSATNPRALWESPRRPTSELLLEAFNSGQAPVITDESRAEALVDLRYWHAAILVMAPQKHEDALWHTVSQLLPTVTPQLTGGVWVWDVRQLVG